MQRFVSLSQSMHHQLRLYGVWGLSSIAFRSTPGAAEEAGQGRAGGVAAQPLLLHCGCFACCQGASACMLEQASVPCGAIHPRLPALHACCGVLPIIMPALPSAPCSCCCRRSGYNHAAAALGQPLSAARRPGAGRAGEQGLQQCLSGMLQGLGSPGLWSWVTMAVGCFKAVQAVQGNRKRLCFFLELSGPSRAPDIACCHLP